MIDALLSLIPGGSLTALLAAVVAALVGVWRVYRSGKKAGKNEAKVEEAKANERHMQEIERAARARNSVPRGLPERDKYRRD